MEEVVYLGDFIMLENLIVIFNGSIMICENVMCRKILFLYDWWMVFDLVIVVGILLVLVSLVGNILIVI